MTPCTIRGQNGAQTIAIGTCRQMDVSIDQAGNEKLPATIDTPRSGGHPNPSSLADRSNAAFRNDNRLIRQCAAGGNVNQRDVGDGKLLLWWQLRISRTVTEERHEQNARSETRTERLTQQSQASHRRNNTFGTARRRRDNRQLYEFRNPASSIATLSSAGQASAVNCGSPVVQRGFRVPPHPKGDRDRRAPHV